MCSLQEQDRHDIPGKNSWSIHKRREREKAYCVQPVPVEAYGKEEDIGKHMIFIFNISSFLLFASVA